MSIQFGSDAKQEIREALLYSSTNFGLGKELRDEIRRSVNLIMQDPGRFRARAGGVRILKLERFTYSIIFTHSDRDSTIHVYAFAHTSLRPGYWKSRI